MNLTLEAADALIAGRNLFEIHYNKMIYKVSDCINLGKIPSDIAASTRAEIAATRNILDIVETAVSEMEVKKD